MNSDEAYISRVLESLFSGLRYTRYRTDAQTGKLNSDGTLNTDVSDGLAAPYIWVRFGEDRAAVPVLSKIRDGAGIPVIVAFDTLIIGCGTGSQFSPRDTRLWRKRDGL